ncbi:hypothetical protein PAGU2638_13710 [Lysobacter sp. PAGU 2638]
MAAFIAAIYRTPGPGVDRRASRGDDGHEPFNQSARRVPGGGYAVRNTRDRYGARLTAAAGPSGKDLC